MNSPPKQTTNTNFDIQLIPFQSLILETSGWGAKSTVSTEDLALESEAAIATWLRLAKALDAQEWQLARIATAVSKYYVPWVKI